MTKMFPVPVPEMIGVCPLTKHDTAGARRTRTTPETEKGGLSNGPRVVTSLLLYGTDTLYFLPQTVKRFTLGSALDQNIAVPSPFVSAQHCRLERQRTSLRVIDLGSKNGTHFEGARERRFYLTPGKAFIAGAWPYRFLALNDEMRTSYPALVDILGDEREHTLGAASETPSPGDMILSAVAGVHLLITGEPHCEQERLARIIHAISLFHERPMIELTPARIPTDRNAQGEFIKQTAARSTLVLDLGDDPAPLPPTFVSLLFAARYQVRVIVLARAAEVAYKALGWQYCDRLQRVRLRPVANRPGAIVRLLDRMFEEHGGPLRTSHLTSENQDAVRNHDWPDNFASLRRAAAWLTAIYRLGTINKAAPVLQVPASSLYRWYSHTLGLNIPLDKCSIV